MRGMRPVLTLPRGAGCSGDMLVQVRQRVKDLIAAGKTMDEVVTAAPTKDLDVRWGSGYVTAKVFTEMVFTSLAGADGSR